MDLSSVIKKHSQNEDVIAAAVRTIIPKNDYPEYLEETIVENDYPDYLGDTIVENDYSEDLGETTVDLENPPEEAPKEATAEYNKACGGEDPNRKDTDLPSTSFGDIHKELEERYNSYCSKEDSAFKVFLLKEVYLLKELLKHPTLNHVLFCNFMSEDFFMQNYFTLNVSLDGKIKEWDKFPLMLRLCYKWLKKNKELLFYDIKVKKTVEWWMIIKEIKYYSIKNVTTAYYFLNLDMNEIYSLKDTKDAERGDTEDTIKIKSKGFKDKIEKNIASTQPNLTKSGENRDDEIILDLVKENPFQMIVDGDSALHNDKLGNRTEHIDVQLNNLEHDDYRLFAEKEKDLDNEIEEIILSIENLPLEKPSTEKKLLVRESVMIRNENNFMDASVLGEIQDVDNVRESDSREVLEGNIDKTVLGKIQDVDNVSESDSREVIDGNIDKTALGKIQHVDNIRESDSREVLEGNIDKTAQKQVEDTRNNYESSKTTATADNRKHTPAQKQVEDTRNNYEASKTTATAENRKHTPDRTKFNAKIDLAKKKEDEEEEWNRMAKTRAKLARRMALATYRAFINKAWNAKLEDEKHRIQRQKREMFMAAWDKELEEERAELMKRKNRNSLPVPKRIRIK